MKQKEDLKIKGDRGAILEAVEAYLDKMSGRDCDRFSMKIRAKAWNRAAKAAAKKARKEAEDRDDDDDDDDD